MNGSNQALIILGSAFVAFILGILLGNGLKMKEHGWKLGLIFSTLALAGTLCWLRPVKQGIDLRGGVILIYEVDEEQTANAAIAQSGDENANTNVDMSALIQALTRRINPSGVREVVIRPYGDKQVEIIIPDVSDAEIKVIKNTIVKSGFLKFRIVADKNRNPYEWEAGEAALNSDDPNVRNGAFVKNESGEVIGEWVRIGREEPAKDNNGNVKNPGELTPFRLHPEVLSSLLTRELVAGEVEALALIDPTGLFNVEGKHLRSVTADFDQNGQPSVNFQMNTNGSQRMAGLTGSNLPDQQSGSFAKLGIVMDGELLSAPRINSTISSSGVIEGNFAKTEVDFLVRVLRAGRLPAVLREEPISENEVSPLLGEDTIRKGKFAITVSIAGVLLFMLFYYWFAGFVACLALLANLVLIVALMILIKGAFTLPGLAGLVLTVGMSVDANVLIFERIREELQGGATLRMAIRNGFSRATSTIVDANVTTLITAIVLYVIGTDTIKGFAITLILGILMSMYTAIFCSRVVFDIAERKKWISRLKMLQALGRTNIDFLGKRKLAAALSVLAIIGGLLAVGARGRNIFDIDFLGGTSAQVMLNDPMPIEDVRSRLLDANIADDLSVTEVKPKGAPPNSVYKIDTSIETEQELQTKISDVFTEGGEIMLKSHEMEFTPAKAIDGQARLQLPRRQPGAVMDDLQLTARSPLNGQLVAWANPQEMLLAQADTAAPVEGIGGGGPPADNRMLKFLSESTLTFDETIGAVTLKEMLEIAAKDRLGMTAPRVDLSAEGWDGRSDKGYKQWNVKFTSSTEDTQKILSAVQKDLSETPVWLSSSKIGSKVAGDMRTKALMAIFVSLLGIVGYIWIRFQRIGFGLAAVVALLHDVAITLGAVALSLWAAKALGFLMIDEFKISLPMVAAFLTIIGYSLNDTIVVFDRIREVKGKSPTLTKDMINQSINQTLSRTLLTSVTTLIVVLILYLFGGQGIHGFAFALLVGVLVGTYSSIFVASPTLLWMTEWSDQRQAKQKAAARAGKQQKAGANA